MVLFSVNLGTLAAMTKRLITKEEVNGSLVGSWQLLTQFLLKCFPSTRKHELHTNSDLVRVVSMQ